MVFFNSKSPSDKYVVNDNVVPFDITSPNILPIKRGPIMESRGSVVRKMMTDEVPSGEGHDALKHILTRSSGFIMLKNDRLYKLTIYLSVLSAFLIIFIFIMDIMDPTNTITKHISIKIFNLSLAMIIFASSIWQIRTTISRVIPLDTPHMTAPSQNTIG